MIEEKVDLDAMLAALAEMKEEMVAESRHIPFSQIDDTLQIYREHTVILMGVDLGAEQVMELMDYFHIKVSAFCSRNKAHWNQKVLGIPVISPQDLEKRAKKKEVLVQISQMKHTEDILEDTEETWAALGVKKVISWKEATEILDFLKKYQIMKECPEALSAYKHHNTEGRVLSYKRCLVQHLIKYMETKQTVILCLPSKTGDHTLKETFDKCNIPYFSTLHQPEVFDLSISQNLPHKVKIFTAVRDPIARDISTLYEELSVIAKLDRTELLEFDFGHHPMHEGGNVQELFDLYFQHPSHGKGKSELAIFMDKFQEHIIDLRAYPFDQEKGYTIIKKGNLEVFVYQLEKMNYLVKEVADFLGESSIKEWTIGNTADSKWISKSYEDAQKRLQFSEQYFNMCYDDPYIRHFYSEADIEKFKSRWKENVDSGKLLQNEGL